PGAGGAPRARSDVTRREGRSDRLLSCGGCLAAETCPRWIRGQRPAATGRTERCGNRNVRRAAAVRLASGRATARVRTGLEERGPAAMGRTGAVRRRTVAG